MTLDELKEVYFGENSVSADDLQIYDWTLLKCELNKVESENFPRPKHRQVWWCAIGKNIGQEQSCSVGFERPVLVIKTFGGTFWGLPITSSDPSGKKASHPLYYELDAIEYLNNEGESKTLHGYIALHQLRLFDGRRLKRRILKI